jgi:hypothetical protein
MSDEYFAIGTIALKVEHKEGSCSHLISITPKKDHEIKINKKEYIAFHATDSETNINKMIFLHPKDKDFKVNKCIARQLASVATTSISIKIIIKQSGDELFVTGVEFPAK